MAIERSSLRPGMVTYACNPNTRKVKTGGSGVQGHSGQYIRKCLKYKERLLAIAAPLRDQSSVPSIHIRYLTAHPITQAPADSTPLASANTPLEMSSVLLHTDVTEGVRVRHELLCPQQP